MITSPKPFSEAIGFILSKEQLPAEWDSAMWREQEPDFRTKAFSPPEWKTLGSSTVRRPCSLTTWPRSGRPSHGRTGTQTTALSVSDRSHFVQLMRDFMIAEGMAKASEFKDVNQKDVTDIRSLARLNLIFDTNVRQAYGFGQWKQGMAPAVLKAFPAARLIRVRGVMIPRLRHEANLGEVALKTDTAWWAGYINSRDIGGFDVPWGPYGFHSGMSQEDVSREEAERLGLPVPPSPPEDESRITDGTQASTRKMDPALKAKLLDELRSGKKARSPQEAAKEAAAEVRREMLQRGLEEAQGRGDEAAAQKYRKAFAELPGRGLRVVDEGDSIRIDGT